MIRIWKTIFVLFLLSLFALGTIAWLYVKKAPDILSDALSRKLNVPVHVDKIDFSLNRITISGITVENLQTSILPNALTTHTLIIKAPLINFLKDNLFVDEISLDQIYLGLEFDEITSPKGNWTRLLENFYTRIDTYDKKESARTVSIAKLLLKNIQTDVVYKTKPKKIHTLPLIKEILLTNIQSHGGLPLDQIANSVLGQMLLTVFQKENLKNMLKELLNPANTLKQLLSPFKGLFSWDESSD
ncbi:MAG: hypothetical protein A2Y28_03745 [Chlamydiae bacterium GWC2_50_10]|nr:MAG: hypothetical protein A2Z85_05220 [Chlamydiae bacterium GWA2_50_15]OGN53690.1 MAG: hypothetical protein A2Y28_03745 [Chlamydiae bacterium GWC2_50_10]OGN55054.1 MAG: hypothetical protein A2098_03115 [Chlamydiae bacterium GWF2_49_8]OGN58943.1 MAG: hypothetical protein A3D18_01740 [Chlamydiae bacterium RIFCSPHIGHO2_02_FULL_49_29]OGN63218.1 MAG: hypothetical protein A3E26_03795 [Chlamydiae bacterium RIFCSPHIGHO2_12_FULL_49_32]OGN69121.1 MAG: hypothetical protein A3I15_00470 [Chlamydiae bact